MNVTHALALPPPQLRERFGGADDAVHATAAGGDRCRQSDRVARRRSQRLLFDRSLFVFLRLVGLLVSTDTILEQGYFLVQRELSGRVEASTNDEHNRSLSHGVPVSSVLGCCCCCCFRDIDNAMRTQRPTLRWAKRSLRSATSCAHTCRTATTTTLPFARSIDSARRPNFAPFSPGPYRAFRLAAKSHRSVVRIVCALFVAPRNDIRHNCLRCSSNRFNVCR
jgi:hypothetical protein